MDKFFHSVYLDEDACKGCINCIKRCPTQAIRVRDGKARITNEFCIDCGECVRICTHHAKKIRFDHMDVLDHYKYTVALPAPSLYSQFNNLEDTNIVLTALIALGFDDVFEVSGAAELVSAASRRYISEHSEQMPFISTACPSVVRLIRVRFPNLIEHLLPIQPPVEVAAAMARERAIEKTGLKPEDIGIIFISPCPSKVTYVQSPLGVKHSQIDNVLAIKDIYPLLLSHMPEAEKHPLNLSASGRIGIGWAGAGGEAAGLIMDGYLAADGIENVIKVLEDLEDEKLQNLHFIELNACNGGCVGGVLTVENAYAAKAKLVKLSKYLPVSISHLPEDAHEPLLWKAPVTYEPVFRLGKNLAESFVKMSQVETLCTKFPDLDCGACGAPTCRALAEDIVRGNASETDCIYLLRKHIHELTYTINNVANNKTLDEISSDEYVLVLQEYISQLLSEMEKLDTDKDN